MSNADIGTITRKLGYQSLKECIELSHREFTKRLSASDPEQSNRLWNSLCKEYFPFENNVVRLSDQHKFVNKHTPCTLGDDGINQVFGGGVYSGFLTEIVGESSAGKTQLCLQLCLCSQLPLIQNGLDGDVAYISTEEKFPITRLAEMIPSFARRFGFDFDTAEEIIERMTRRIHTKFILERDQFVFMVLYQLEKFISENNIKLVIIDSIAALFRYHSVLAIDEKDEFQKNLHRRECLSNIGNKLKELASKFDCAIVVVNQVSDYIPGAINTNNTVALPVNTDGLAAASTGSIKSSPPFHSTGHDSSFGNYDSSGINGGIAIFGDKIPALGKVWASCVNSRVFLKVKKSEIRVKGGYDLSEYAQHTTAAGNGVGLSNSFLSTGSFVSVGSSFDGSGRDPGRGSSRVMIGSKIPWSRPVCCSIRICSDGVFSC